MEKPRRAMTNQQGLQARNTQAARDALRRRQKEKKARIVKRHVRYKDRKKLLEELSLSEREAPIVAAELSRPEIDGFSESQHQADAQGKKRKSAKQPLHSNATEVKKNDVAVEGEADSSEKLSKKRVERSSKNEKVKYLPFTKERKAFARLQEERAARQKEREEKIEKREQMLMQSKKHRNARAKQYRKVTTRGQPRLKHRLDDLLTRIQKQ